jgi:RNA polymerase sigma-70 factor (ECF subfamily)
MTRHSPQDDLYREAAAAHRLALERIVRGYEANPDRQRDLLQEIHLALWQSFENFEGRCSIKTWVYRVAHNTAATHVVRERRTRAALWVSLEEIEGMPDTAFPDGIADRQLALNRLLDLIRSLKPVDRQVMLLHLEGLDAESIGEVVGLSAGHVRVQIHRIKNVLARRFHGGSHE